MLGLTAATQVLVYLLSGSVALLADLIHNARDASTAIPLGVAFLLRSPRAECIAGLFFVAAIFVSACFAGYEAIARLIDPNEPKALGALAAAGAVGFAAAWGRESSTGAHCRAGVVLTTGKPEMKRGEHGRR